MNQLRTEWGRLRRAAGRLDVQTAVVLAAAALLVFLHKGLGSPRFFREHFAELFSPDLTELLGWVWRFGVQFGEGFVLPVLILVVGFRRKPREIGLGIGDWRFGLKAMAAYLPVVLVGTWILSDQASFQRMYPHFRGAVNVPEFLLVYEAAYLLYWIGWEYLWRGFVLFGTAHKLGLYSIFVQALPFAILHASKPVPEQILSVLGGVALGAVVWRARSFWIAVPIHAVQMALIDFFCARRITGEIHGISPANFMDLFR